jgi:hypothetical protein
MCKSNTTEYTVIALDCSHLLKTNLLSIAYRAGTLRRPLWVELASMATPQRVSSGVISRSVTIAYFASASRLALAQALFRGNAFMGGPPPVPQAHGPPVLASVMQGQDFVFRQLHT